VFRLLSMAALAGSAPALASDWPSTEDATAIVGERRFDAHAGPVAPLLLPLALPETLPVALPVVLPAALPVELPVVLPLALPVALPAELPVVLPLALPEALPLALPVVLPEALPLVSPLAVMPLPPCDPVPPVSPVALTLPLAAPEVETEPEVDPVEGAVASGREFPPELPPPLDAWSSGAPPVAHPAAIADATAGTATSPQNRTVAYHRIKTSNAGLERVRSDPTTVTRFKPRGPRIVAPERR